MSGRCCVRWFARAGVPALAGGALLAASALSGSTAGAAVDPATVDAAPHPAVLAQEAEQTYVVVAGDTLFSIAQRFATTVQALVEANDIADPDLIQVGQELIVPAAPDGEQGAPVTEEPSTEEGDAEEPATEEPAGEEPMSDEPATEEPAADAPADDVADPDEAATAGAITGESYTVEAGDTLTRIAARSGTTVAALVGANQITDPNLIVVGQVLAIPAAGESTPTGGSAPASEATFGELPLDRFDAASSGDAQIDTQADVRFGRHTGFDRFVLEFAADTGAATYAIAYADMAPPACGSGAEVALAGEAVLVVRISDSAIQDEAGNLTIPQRDWRPGLPVIQEAREICGFEAESIWVLGLTARSPFRVTELSAPHRLVIDIAHETAGGAATLDDGAEPTPTDGSSAADYPRVNQLAPIEELVISAAASDPPVYQAEVTSGLPSGCAEFDRIDVERDGTTVTLSVWNWMPDPAANVVCTLIYGTTTHVVDLGADFMAGETYTVVANDEVEQTFVAE